MKKIIAIIILAAFVFIGGCTQPTTTPAPKESPKETKTAKETTSPEATSTPDEDKPKDKQVTAEDVRMAEKLVNEGRRLDYKREYKEARAKFNEALDKNPREIDAYMGIAATYKDQRDYPSAIKAIDKAIELDPKNPKLFLLKGRTLNGSYRYDESIETFKKLVELNPDKFKSYKYLASAYAGMKKHDKAKEIMKKAAERFPNDYEPLKAYISILKSEAYRAKNTKEKIAIYREIIKKYDEAINKAKQAGAKGYKIHRLAYNKAKAYERIYRYNRVDQNRQAAVKAYKDFLSEYGDEAASNQKRWAKKHIRRLQKK